MLENVMFEIYSLKCTFHCVTKNSTRNNQVFSQMTIVNIHTHIVYSNMFITEFQ